MSLSDNFRARRDVALRDLIVRSRRAGGVSILDVGGRVAYWERVGIDFLREQNARVTLLNLSANEIGSDDRGIFDMRIGDATALDMADHSFDLVHSNSVIEHVGGWQAMRAFARETRRVGINYYVQTPYFWCPIDPHFARFPMIHWLPAPLRLRAFEMFPIAHRGKAVDMDDAQDILADAWLMDRRQFVELFSDAHISFERLLGLPKSLIAVRCAN
jgi:hypothetical protein